MRRMERPVKATVEFTRLVRDIKFFSALNIGLLERVLSCVMLYGYDKGERVCRQGDPGDSCFVVRSGRLSVEVRSGLWIFSRKVAELGPGDIFGEMALLCRRPRSASVHCLEDTEVFVILADNFNAVLSRNPEFRAEMKRLTAERNFELSAK